MEFDIAMVLRLNVLQSFVYSHLWSKLWSAHRFSCKSVWKALMLGGFSRIIASFYSSVVDQTSLKSPNIGPPGFSWMLGWSQTGHSFPWSGPLVAFCKKKVNQRDQRAVPGSKPRVGAAKNASLLCCKTVMTQLSAKRNSFISNLHLMIAGN